MLKFPPILWILLALSLPLRAQDLTSEQTKAVQKVITFYTQMGDQETAKRLQDGLKDGTVKFGPTPGNANAACDMSSKKININPASVEGVNSASLESWRATANLAATISHEIVHKDQDPWAWRGSVWKEMAGYGNACEQQAWGGTMQKMVGWIRQVQGELGSKQNRSAREQAEVAQRLQMLCQATTVLRNDYVAERGNIGDLRLTDSVGIPMSLEELMSQVAAIEKQAKDVIGNAGVLSKPFDGNYRGSISGQGTGSVAFKIQGFTVVGRVNGSYKGDPISGSVSGRVDADGNLNLTVSGTLMGSLSPGGKASAYPFTGRLTGRVWNGRASGNWFASNQYGKPVGTWSAAK